MKPVAVREYAVMLVEMMGMMMYVTFAFLMVCPIWKPMSMIDGEMIIWSLIRNESFKDLWTISLCLSIRFQG